MEIKVNFLYKDRIIAILSKRDEEIVKVFSSLIKKINPETSVDDYEYYYKNEEIGQESTLEKTLNIKDNSSIKEVTISVKRRVKFCKCPECNSNDCIINLSNYLCAFYGCKYNKWKAHEVITVYDNYKVKQSINYSNIRCQAPGCGKNLQNDEYNFYKCLDCSKLAKMNIYFCTQCKSKHTKKIILL